MAARWGHVWYETTCVGRLSARDDGRLRFAYDDAWLDEGFPISLTLPLDRGGAEVDAHAYFEGLLPEGRARKRITRQLKIDPEDDAALLFAIGGDCAGALSVLPDDEQPDFAAGDRVAIGEDELIALVRSGGTAAVGGDRPLRFSLAGAQDKLAVIVEDDGLWLPTATDPSSHILKFETTPWVCFAEHMGAALARQIGLATCETTYVDAEKPYLRIERYDRRIEDGRRRRLHQEDVAQALGYASDQKYEQDGGPTLADVAALLRSHVEDPIGDITRLRDWQLASYLLGNSDAHAKNLALSYQPGTSVPRLAPAYDVICIEFLNRTGAARFDRSMAFHVGGRAAPEEIRRSDWDALARAMQISPAALLRRLAELAASLPGLAGEARRGFAEAHGDNQVYDRFEEAIGDRCRWVTQNVL